MTDKAKKPSKKAAEKVTEAATVNQLSAAGFSAAQILALRTLFKGA